ncbi:hypothetical protein EVAR_42469_1 [Eumeta japonica]|uniref:Histone-lysine N-methyltransferase SETMAR n=1 Tax=Eumeta variegata TaxID=151549 RepID=A0A4C1XYJ9_EUMVA|nr:hypothetical protein EVAR_42469_1 [Eumeta japonica]
MIMPDQHILSHQILREFGWEVLIHPPYSPVSVSSEFFRTFEGQTSRRAIREWTITAARGQTGHPRSAIGTLPSSLEGNGIFNGDRAVRGAVRRRRGGAAGAFKTLYLKHDIIDKDLSRDIPLVHHDARERPNRRARPASFARCTCTTRSFPSMDIEQIPLNIVYLNAVSLSGSSLNLGPDLATGSDFNVESTFRSNPDLA